MEDQKQQQQKKISIKCYFFFNIRKMNYKHFINTSKKEELEIFLSHRREGGKL